jgi:anaerobic selenocysteine-containing dehydrogenase
MSLAHQLFRDEDIWMQSRAAESSTERHVARSFCRICNSSCGMVLTVEDGRISDIKPDRSHLLTQGYGCFKGVAAAQLHNDPSRLLRPLRKTAGGDFEPIEVERALDEIAARLLRLRDARGANSIGMYSGSGSNNAPTVNMRKAFFDALGSTQRYSTITIDQSAKAISFGRLGAWAGGVRRIEQSDVALLVGVNPLVSHGAYQFLDANPVKRLREAKQRGLRLIVIDPRRTETARHADLFLQPLPGKDAEIAAGLLNVVLQQGWHDTEFCARYVHSDQLARLRKSLAPFEACRVETSAGLSPGSLQATAQLFARDGRTGALNVGTGVTMAPNSNLAVHLFDSLNVLCGRLPRAGELVATVDLLSPESPLHAEVIAPSRPWEACAASRIRGAGVFFGERLTSTLAEEITTPGADQLRALLVSGGNPLAAVPDQRRIVEAFKTLDLLVVVEPYMTNTARLADYILPPTLMYERSDISFGGIMPFYPMPWAQYSAAMVPPPAGSSLVDDWYPFWALAGRMGLTLQFAGRPIDMQHRPTGDELLEIGMRGLRVELQELKLHPGGMRVEPAQRAVLPARPGHETRFEVLPPDVAADLQRVAAQLHHQEDVSATNQFSFLLSVRRAAAVMNTAGVSLPTVQARLPYNPAFFNPADLQQLGLASGQRVILESAHGRIEGVAKADEDVRRGVVSMSHAWGGLPGDEQDGKACTGLLIDSSRNVESINAMPTMTAIPIRILVS